MSIPPFPLSMKWRLFCSAYPFWRIIHIEDLPRRLLLKEMKPPRGYRCVFLVPLAFITQNAPVTSWGLWRESLLVQNWPISVTYWARTLCKYCKRRNLCCLQQLSHWKCLQNNDSADLLKTKCDSLSQLISLFITAPSSGFCCNGNAGLGSWVQDFPGWKMLL